MKLMKKLATLMLAVCLLVPCFSILTHAADGKIMFTDPSTKTGETVEIKGVVERTSGNFGKMEITMSYDTSMLQFQSGNNVTETSAGTLTYSYDATPVNNPRVEFVMKFMALKEGNTTLKITNAAIKNVSGTVLNYTKGSSAIKIAKGTNVPTVTPSTTTDVVVEVNGEEYKIANGVPQNEIPEGYQAAKLEYDLNNYDVLYSEDSKLYLAYLVGSDNVGKLFMYVDEDATFAPYEAVKISDDVTIALLSRVEDIILPAQYKETEIVLNDSKFPGWQDSSNPEFCIVYAINNNGEKSLYRMDTVEMTYQRFEAPEVVIEELRNPVIAKISDLLQNHLDYVVLGTGLGFLLFIVVIVVLSVKLYNRNAELDEIYEEYGIEGDNSIEETEDDIYLDLEEDEDDEDSGEEDTNKVMEAFVQEGMKEVFPEEETTAEIQEKDEVMIAIEPLVSKENKDSKEESLGQALQQQMQEEAEEKEDSEEDFFENFTMDFIDLDD